MGSNPSQSEKAEKAEKKQTAKERQKWEKEDKKAEGASPRTDGKTRRHHPECRKKNLHSESHHIFANIKQLMLYPFFSFNFALFKRFRF